MMNGLKIKNIIDNIVKMDKVKELKIDSTLWIQRLK